MLTATWGLPTDELVPADYDGDGQTDFAVYRRSDGVWYLLTSTSGYNPRYFQTTLPDNLPVSDTHAAPADYDGDGKADFAVIFNGQSWFIFQSESNTMKRVVLPCRDNFIIPSDFSGDGYADPACVYVQFDVRYVWSYKKSQNDQQVDFFWGFGPNNDFLVPDDYDNDGHTDIAIYRHGQWWIYPSNTLQPYVVNFGVGQDIPAQWANLRVNN
jgi:hypothetical protein